MRAIYFDGDLKVREDHPKPKPEAGQALIRTRLAGICNTDLEITRGYLNFTGVLGHEFVGEVVTADETPELVGKRVAGEINLYCGRCPTCLRGDVTHCPNRTSLGIDRHHGVMAEYFTLPTGLLYPLPDAVSDRQAVFVEPLAAALEITDRLHVRPTHSVIVLGDGKLGTLIAQVLRLTGCDLLVVGKHEEKLAVMRNLGVRTRLVEENLRLDADIVVEATGSPIGFATARQLVRPRGQMVLKSTFHGDVTVDLSSVVVDEVSLIGSRCGPFAPAIRLLELGLVAVDPLISDQFPLSDGLKAFERAATPGVLKVLLAPE